MNVSGLGSLSSWYASMRSTTESTATSRSSTSSSSSTDAATISQDGFAALLQSLAQGQMPGRATDDPSSSQPDLSDDQAARISDSLKTNNASLFKALDSDQNDSLSATELKTAMESLKSAFDANRPTQGAGGPPPAGGGRPPPPPEMTDDQAASIGSSLGKDNASLFAALDSDSSGSLSAKELKTAMEALKGNHDQGTDGRRGGTSSSTSRDSSSPYADAIAAEATTSWSDYRANLMSDLLQSLSTTSKSA